MGGPTTFHLIQHNNMLELLKMKGVRKQYRPQPEKYEYNLKLEALPSEGSYNACG